MMLRMNRTVCTLLAAAALALLQKGDAAMSAREIAETALHIAGSICVFTNQNLTLEELDSAV